MTNHETRIIDRIIADAKEMKYFSAIQCRDAETGKVGTFIRDSNKVRLTPVFDGLYELYPWMHQNGWRDKPNGEPWEVEKAY